MDPIETTQESESQVLSMARDIQVKKEEVSQLYNQVKYYRVA